MNKHPYVTDKKYDYLASILLPTRKRINYLIACLESIKNKTKNHKKIEVIVRADNDDTETIENLSRVEEYNKHFDMKFIIDERWGGYADLHMMQNQMYLQSSGEFLIGMNDDAVIHSDGWDTYLQKYSGCIGLVEAKVKEYINGSDVDIHKPREIPWIEREGQHGTKHTFIILHRLVPETLGYYCLHSSADRQWDMFVYNEPSLKIIEHGIELHHHILPAEHIKDGIVTYPDSIYRVFKEQIQRDSYNLVTYLKKNNFRD
jgi:glycosyltransferase involved in cell wall biosynthesis